MLGGWPLLHCQQQSGGGLTGRQVRPRPCASNVAPSLTVRPARRTPLTFPPRLQVRGPSHAAVQCRHLPHRLAGGAALWLRRESVRAQGAQRWAGGRARAAAAGACSAHRAAALTPASPPCPLQPCMFVAGMLYLLGSGLQAGAQNLGMLIAGRCVLGLGVGCSAVTAPVYIAELAPFASRGGLATLVQAATVSGILAAQVTAAAAAVGPPPGGVCGRSLTSASLLPLLQLINYATQYIPGWGWRLSLGLSAMPACILVLGGIVLPESPSFLIEKCAAGLGRWVPALLREPGVLPRPCCGPHLQPPRTVGGARARASGCCACCAAPTAWMPSMQTCSRRPRGRPPWGRCSPSKTCCSRSTCP